MTQHCRQWKSFTKACGGLHFRERGGRGQNAISVLSDWEDRVSTTLPDGRTFRGVTEDPAIEELAKRFLNLLVARELCEGLEISIERIEP